jgi:ionotropic glutamate receptor
VVLLVGLALAVLVAILEFCWNAKMNANSDQVALCSEMAEEAKFAFRCRGPRRRPALTRHYCARCQTGHSNKPNQPPVYHDYHTYPHQHHNLNGLHCQ